MSERRLRLSNIGTSKHWVAVLGVAAFTAACGGSNDDEDKESERAAHICSEAIACGYQVIDQQSCAQLFEGFFSAAQIAACDACVSAEPCETEQMKCEPVCSL